MNKNEKDPKLQKMRNNLRLVILKECSKRQMEISDQEHSLTHDKNGNSVRISEETSEILQDLSRKWWEIERPLRASIVICPGCNKHNKDMKYHRKSSTWFCIQCYERRFS
jgi:hypothetical protein